MRGCVCMCCVRVRKVPGLCFYLSCLVGRMCVEECRSGGYSFLSEVLFGFLQFVTGKYSSVESTTCASAQQQTKQWLTRKEDDGERKRRQATRAARKRRSKKDGVYGTRTEENSRTGGGEERTRSSRGKRKELSVKRTEFEEGKRPMKAELERATGDVVEWLVCLSPFRETTSSVEEDLAHERQDLRGSFAACAFGRAGLKG